MRARKVKGSTSGSAARSTSEGSGLASKPASLKNYNFTAEEKRFQKEVKVRKSPCLWDLMIE